MNEADVANALITVLPNSRWIGVSLSRAFLALQQGADYDDVARSLYQGGSFTLAKAKEILPELKSSFIKFVPQRGKLGSAENPITKLFPAAITEQRFLTEIDNLRTSKPSVDYQDERFVGHSLVDFVLKEGDIQVPVNVKNAGTRFESAKQLVGLEPDDCIPIPVYKAYDALDKEPNLLYIISVDYGLINTISQRLVPLFNQQEQTTWKILNTHAGTRIRDAEDFFIYNMTLKYWAQLQNYVTTSIFHVISARKCIRILQNQPKRTPGIGLRAWGTGANAEVNVHVCVSRETKGWNEIAQRISSQGLSDILNAINRKSTEVVYDPEI